MIKSYISDHLISALRRRGRSVPLLLASAGLGLFTLGRSAIMAAPRTSASRRCASCNTFAR